MLLSQKIGVVITLFFRVWVLHRWEFGIWVLLLFDRRVRRKPGNLERFGCKCIPDTMQRCVYERP